MGYTSMHIDCPICHARFHMDHGLFKGAKGIRLRCRKCGNSLDVLNPAGIGSDRNVPNDTPFSRDPSGNSGFEPACLPREDGEDKESGEENWRKTLSELADAPAPLPKSLAKARWSPLIVLFLLLLFFVGGSAYLIFTKVGKGLLSGIGQNLADAVTFFRS